MHYIGIDGCGRYAKLMMVDENKKTIGRHSGASADLRRVSAASVAQNVTVLTRELSRLTNTTIKDCGGLCFAAEHTVAGNQEAAIIKMFKNIGFSCPVRVVSCERATLSAKTGGEPGILLLAGDDVTGYIYTDSGEVYAGGYGSLAETGGSAYSIGVAAIRRVLMSFDGRATETLLTGSILNHFGVKDVPGLLSVINNTELNINTISELSGYVKSIAANGDKPAQEIESNAARELAAFALALVARFHKTGTRTTLVMGGSIVIQHESVSRQAAALIRSAYADIQIMLADEKPEAGAALLAMMK